MKVRVAAAIAAFTFLAVAPQVPANASTLTFTGTLLGTNEVPPNAAPGIGFITLTLDDVANSLAVHEVYAGLTSPAIAAHLHCCAAPGSLGPIVLDFTGFPLGTTSGTYDHSFSLTTDLIGITVSEIIAGLEAGLGYTNIHTDNAPTGEIRAQLAPTPLPAALPLFATGLGVLGLLGWRRKRKQAA